MAETKLVAIVNVTPDSFSDGGKAFDAQDAIRAVEAAAQAGADIIDIGAESTRPGATPLSPEEEWQRLEPVLTAVCGKYAISVDTYHPETVKKALALGVQYINDVTGFANPAMVEAVRDADCILVFMHSLSVPADKNIVMPAEADVVEELLQWAHARIGTLINQGIARERLVFDPGVGFGKTARQSMAILDGIGWFRELGVPLFIGHSRKSFLGGNVDERDAKMLAISQELAMQGVDYLRMHDIAVHRQMLDEIDRMRHAV